MLLIRRMRGIRGWIFGLQARGGLGCETGRIVHGTWPFRLAVRVSSGMMLDPGV